MAKFSFPTCLNRWCAGRSNQTIEDVSFGTKRLLLIKLGTKFILLSFFTLHIYQSLLLVSYSPCRFQWINIVLYELILIHIFRPMPSNYIVVQEIASISLDHSASINMSLQCQSSDTSCTFSSSYSLLEVEGFCPHRL